MGSFQPSISFDGKRIAYTSYSSNLISEGVIDDQNGFADVFLWKADNNKTSRISRTSLFIQRGGRRVQVLNQQLVAMANSLRFILPVEI